ncbi:MAG: DUF748 domain-containing protein [Xanthomonadaceae bacterium]|nr:DUF748 domain-containing protein [Xanthomonadaceae bacterium]
MIDRHLLDDPRLALVRQHAERLYRSRRLRRALLVLGILLAVFGLLGFFAAPPLLKSQLQSRLGTLLGRPVTIGAVHFDPYTLRLDLDRLHIGAPDGHAAFVDVDRLTINASWTSLFRRAPVLDELALRHPQLHITRLAPQRFNFSDLLERLKGKPDPNAPPSRFFVANISVHDGDIVFDDKVLATSHHVEQLELGIPFLANLPADTDLFVQPLLTARVDGSLLRIDGKTKPFASSRESELDFQFDHLDLPRYLGYVPTTLPVAVPSGQLSGQLQLHFVDDGKNTQLRLGGQLALDDFKLDTPAGVALLALGHGTAQLADVQPLISRYHFGAVQLDGAAVHYLRGAGGHSNFDALTAIDAGQPSSQPASPPNDVRIDSLVLQQGRFVYADPGTGGGQPAALTLENMHGTLRGLSTVPAPAGSLDLAAQLNGGAVRASGKLDLAGARFDGKLALQGVAVAPLQSLALPPLRATIAHGRLDADGRLQAAWGKTLNLHLEPAQFGISELVLKRHDGTTPVAWKSMRAKLARFDLAGSQAQIESLRVQGLKLDVNRLRDGRFDLADLVDTAPAARAPAAKAAPAWHWSLAHLDIANSDVAFRDLRADPPAPVALHIDRYGIDGLSDNLREPVKVTLTGLLGKRSYALSGQVRPQPLDARLRVTARGLDIAPLQSLIGVPLNVRIGSALLSADGRLRYSDRGDAPARIDYRGQATLGRVRVQDKLTGDDFLRWHSLSASNLLLQLGEGAPHADIGGLALNDFYARVIVNGNGRLNLLDVVTNPAEAPVSVTRAEKTPRPVAAPAAAAAPSGPAPSGPAPQIRIGQITLARGQLNYTDNFIKPNYSANVTGLTGKIGAFGTREGPPAELILQGKLDEDSPVDITGSINPLTPMAFLDIKAKAGGVELDHLSPYSRKYAGYPITGGVLNVDVHYVLDQRKLTADNHIFIDQLTFGDRIDAPGVSHLPVKLAVALLRNSQGQIDVHVPVSGSLDDPQFSMGGLIWHAFANLIARAATAPFRLLASLGGGQHADLGHVGFAPGSAVLDDAAQSRLARLVKLLHDKPSLQLDITGRMDPALDEKGLRKVMVDDLIRQAKADHDGDKVDPATLTLTPDEYAHYLTRVYKRAKFPKPKDLIGLTKSQPPEVMRQLLEANMPVDAAALRRLAERRAEAVQQWMQGKIDEKRITLHAPKLDAKGIKDKGRTTRVDFGLH